MQGDVQGHCAASARIVGVVDLLEPVGAGAVLAGLGHGEMGEDAVGRRTVPSGARPGGMTAVSPGRNSSTGPPSTWTRPTPETAQSVWPTAWLCQAVRAPGLKVTLVARIREGAVPTRTSSWWTSPVNLSAGAFFVARSPTR